jgi:hypothetical protein
MHQRRRPLLQRRRWRRRQGGARAQPAWPDRPVRFVIGGSAGGVSDILLRILENRLRESLASPSCSIREPAPAAWSAPRSSPVGRRTATILHHHIASHGIGPTLYKRLSFDP